MCVDLDKIWEQHWKSFFEEYNSNEKLREAMKGLFGYEHYYYNTKLSEDDVYMVWDSMYSYDEELCVSDPVSCAENYQDYQRDRD